MKIQKFTINQNEKFDFGKIIKFNRNKKWNKKKILI